ncbi:MAG TPA: hypothetical protein VJ755_06020 [Gemmatimonadales bacterium]|nr:hypothetical protein [Gemmatimonadales bacterium]
MGVPTDLKPHSLGTHGLTETKRPGAGSNVVYVASPAECQRDAAGNYEEVRSAHDD